MATTRTITTTSDGTCCCGPVLPCPTLNLHCDVGGGSCCTFGLDDPCGPTFDGITQDMTKETDGGKCDWYVSIGSGTSACGLGGPGASLKLTYDTTTGKWYISRYSGFGGLLIYSGPPLTEVFPSLSPFSLSGSYATEGACCDGTLSFSITEI